MNVLFIFSRHSQDPRDSTLTKDLSEEFVKNGVNVYVMTMSESRDNKHTNMAMESGCNVLRVKTGNYFNCKTKIEKVKTILTLPEKFVNAAKKYLKDVKIDLIVTHTPFVSNKRIIRPLKDFFQCKAHLILWDIFPKNAFDLGIIQNKYIFKVFQNLEIKMYKSFDHIWCMSNGNVDYMRNNFPELSSVGIELLYNSSKIKPLPIISKSQIRQKFGYSDSDIIAIFGGNMGVPQALECIIYLADRAIQNNFVNAKFLFVGKGTQTDYLKDLANDMKLSNVKFIEQLPRDDYENITFMADIGIVSLDKRFTVPNFPSKTTDYFKLSLPILASLDNCAMNDYGDFLLNTVKAGRCSLSGDIDDLFEQYQILYLDAKLREELGYNGRKFYEKELGVDIAYKKIVNCYNEH
ncbi:MAG: glycosyltransferase family 4 protein [Burkholderiales bacterium]|nr:glycosyltransferase family 4 protein [Burkholderiales bacterium]